MLQRILHIMLLLLALACLAAAPVNGWLKMRPYAGLGLLQPGQPPFGQSSSARRQIYRAPGVGRLTTLSAVSIPNHAMLFRESEAGLPLIVSERRGDWLKVSYDDAGREGWVRLERRDTYQTWPRFLVDRSGRLLSGLRQAMYQLYREPGGDPLEPFKAGELFVVQAVSGDWLRVTAKTGRTGWLRWRDADGRLLISVDLSSSPEKR